MSSASILPRVRITDAWRVLGGPKLRRSGRNHYRGRAWWRDGDGFNISLDDARGVWFDHRDAIGGGVIDLVVLVRGGSREEALHWLAQAQGITLDDRPLSAADRARWVAERNALESHLPAARYWRQSMVAMTERLLIDLKPL
jgi:hypothetical protein